MSILPLFLFCCILLMIAHSEATFSVVNPISPYNTVINVTRISNALGLDIASTNNTIYCVGETEKIPHSLFVFTFDASDLSILYSLQNIDQVTVLDKDTSEKSVVLIDTCGIRTFGSVAASGVTEIQENESLIKAVVWSVGLFIVYMAMFIIVVQTINEK